MSALQRAREMLDAEDAGIEAILDALFVLVGAADEVDAVADLEMIPAAADEFREALQHLNAALGYWRQKVREQG